MCRGLYSIDKKHIVIHSSPKVAPKYRKKVEYEIKQKFLEEEKPTISVCDDLEGIVEYPFNINDKAFKKGLAKIAIGFACKKGLLREDLSLALKINKDTKQGQITNNVLAVPFYPLGIIDKLIEDQKNELEHYPFHNLILFTLDYDQSTSNGKKILICYIELFSTFQWYIILNDEYYGNSLYEYYAQQILKKDDYIVELGRRYYKERSLILQPLGITEEYIDKKYNNRKDKNRTRWNIEEDLIQEETIKQKYKFNFESCIENSIALISNSFLAKIPIKGKDSLDFEDMLDFNTNIGLFFEQSDEGEIFDISSYRRLFYKTNKLKNYYTELTKDFGKLNTLKDYHHIKFHMLNCYIQEECKRKKEEILSSV